MTNDNKSSPSGTPETVILDRRIEEALDKRGIKHGGGDGGGGDRMSDRLTRLETHFEYIQRDLGEIKTAVSVVSELPTKRDLSDWKWQWGAMALAIIVLAVTGIVGGLALINRSVEPPAASQPQTIFVYPGQIPPLSKPSSQHGAGSNQQNLPKAHG